MNVILSSKEEWQQRDIKDPLRYNRLIRKIAGKVYNANKWGTRGLHFEDLVSTGFLSICKRIDSFDSERATDSTFVYMIVSQGMNKYVNKLRTGGEGRATIGHFITTPEDQDFTAYIGAVEPDLSSIIANDLLDYMKDLPHFEVFVRYVNGETSANIAKDEGVTRQRINQRIIIFKEEAVNRLRLADIHSVGGFVKQNNNRGG